MMGAAAWRHALLPNPAYRRCHTCLTCLATSEPRLHRGLHNSALQSRCYPGASFCGVQVSDLYDPREQWASYVLNAIKAKELFIRDVSYIVRANEVRQYNVILVCYNVVLVW